MAEEVSQLFEGAGFEAESRYVQRETVNHKEKIHAKRIFVQGKFRKKIMPDTSPPVVSTYVHSDESSEGVR